MKKGDNQHSLLVITWFLKWTGSDICKFRLTGNSESTSALPKV